MRKYNFISYKKIYVGFLQLIMALLLIGCDNLLEVDPPTTEVLASQVFSSDANANAALVGMYSSMVTASAFMNIGYACSLSADETDGSNPDYPFTDFGTNTLTASDYGASNLWTGFYKTIYQANNIIENVTNSTGMSDSIKTQFVGQAKFVRALNFFYLVNMFGPVPLTVTPDVKTNNALARAATADVYAQIVSDLKDAETKLPANYSNYSSKRDKPNKRAASALLARVYLYMDDYVNAEEKATEVINTTSLYSLLSTADIGNVFLKDSKESIFAINPQTTTGHWLTNEDYYYYYGSQYQSLYYILTSSLANAFEIGDVRKTAWLGSFDYSGTTYYYGAKYRDYDGSSDPLEYSIVLRLSEQYLIRAEARARQSNVTGTAGAVADINVIRTRAGLASLDAANMTQAQCLTSIEQERRVELFLEYGNRWFDLKRTNRADAVLGALKPATWKSTAVLYPIPLTEIQNAPQLTQNDGY
ncbi:MAG: RagB/SusD domain protein [Bacteroidetes bacterium]|nr:RagB/SusD domain protein [Bacteroidota bacterium]